MSASLKRTRGEAVLFVVPVANNVVADASSPEANLHSSWETLSDESHLVECPACGLRNGQSAARCWGCEAELLPTHGSILDVIPAPEAAGWNEADAAQALDDVWTPLELHSPAVEHESAGSDRSAVVAWAPERARKFVNTILFAVFVSLAALAGAGIYLQSRTADFGALKIPTMPNVADTAGVKVSEVDLGAPQERRSAQAARGLSASTTPPAIVQDNPKLGANARTRARLTTEVPFTASPVEGAPGTRLGPNYAAAPRTPLGVRTEPNSATSMPQVPCNATIAALGLCAEPSIQTKEKP